ncbi:S8 family serine peptidase [Baia soyae]|nr:S8 family serine peptidase [Baia soyae]
MGSLLKKFCLNLLVTCLIISASPFFLIEKGEAKENREAYNKLVIFKDSKIPSEIELHEESDIKMTRIPEIGALKIESNHKSNLDQFILKLKRYHNAEIATIGEDVKVSIPSEFTQFVPKYKDKMSHIPTNTVSEPKENSLHHSWGWDIKKVTAGGASYQIETGNHQVKIAILDSGIDFDHPDLKNNIISQGRSFVPGVETAKDDMGHGTMVAGMIAANGKLLGVGPNLGLVPYKVMSQGDGESSWVVQAIIQATKDDVDVINLSLGTYKSLIKQEDQAVLELYKRAARFASNKGVILVASSGNDALDLSNPSEVANKFGKEGDQLVHAPGGDIPHVITVSSTSIHNLLSKESNYGQQILFTAPGGEFDFSSGDTKALCLTTYPTYLQQSPINEYFNLPAGYVFTAGTSLSAPKVSGAIGVLIAHQKKTKKSPLTTDNMIKILQNSAEDLGEKGKDLFYGFGLVNLHQALKVLDK